MTHQQHTQTRHCHAAVRVCEPCVLLGGVVGSCLRHCCVANTPYPCPTLPPFPCMCFSGLTSTSTGR